ncbi:cobalt-precorrin-6A reductase [Leptolyngbya sp. KIOST-1]|uniref:cobalt-precorrin-6A reductase n=1 Tax=Leptolyngbya sp. KIOST-1 TaxID=1229172 RepID=UPI00055B146C|nr:cobalt-precorrin-6A reductase [Leptolyngbya sp. KIOST-1]
MGVLWIIGGTGEAVRLATALAAMAIPCLVTVTTEAARRGYPTSPYLTVWVERLDVGELEGFIGEWGVEAVLDASHPFAVEISQGAIAAAQALKIPYWRYERPVLERSPAPDWIHSVSGLGAILTPEVLSGERVLLTLGYRWLQHFAPWQTQATLFARILPSAVALAAALKAGFTPDRLIALRPPISAALEKALWQQWQITRVITKASGAPGGEDAKRAVAEQLGISLFVLRRPQIDYPAVYHSQEELLTHCQTWWSFRSDHP